MRIIGLVLAVVVTGGCASSPGTERRQAAQEPGATPTVEPLVEGLIHVALGDSWPEGAHCAGCRTFPETHAESLEDRLGEPVTFQNLSGQAQPFFESFGGGSASLLRAVRDEETFRQEVATGDVIVIATGPNEIETVFEDVESGTCGETRCIRPLAQEWHRNFNSIVEEIVALREEAPTAIRLVNAANPFGEKFDPVYDALTVAVCDAAEAHQAICVDVRPVLEGPDFEQPVNDSSQDAMDAVGRLLLETGVPELQ